MGEGSPLVLLYGTRPSDPRHDQLQSVPWSETNTARIDTASRKLPQNDGTDRNETIAVHDANINRFSSPADYKIHLSRLCVDAQ